MSEARRSIDFGVTEIAPGQVFSFQARPGCVFTAEHFVIDESDHGATFVIAFFVGQKLQKPLFQGPVDGTPSFVFKAPGAFLMFDECAADEPMTLWIQNRHTQSVKVAAQILGKLGTS